ncbi:MAG: 2-phospho-L-lactate transferase [Acidimicrobiales bacterium]
MIVVISGGVGAARMLAGLEQVVDPSELLAIVNTGDDLILHGLYICPDLDTITYTLAGQVNPETGWGLAGESWQAMSALEAYGGHAWFGLGDLDLGTHLFRTQRLAEGASLTTVTSEIVARWGLKLAMLPMSHDRVETRVRLLDGPEIGFQEYFVKRRHSVAVSSVRFAGADSAEPAPGVINAIASAEKVIIAPSNPLVSIDPILAIPGIREAITARRKDVVAVSPIIAGAALKGPADRLLTELGHDASVVGVAKLYTGLARSLIIDNLDVDRVAEIEALGMQAVATESVMKTPEIAAALAQTVLTS